MLKKLSPDNAAIQAKATSNAIRRFLTTFGSEPALTGSSKSALSKVASQLAKEGGERADGAALLKALAPFGV
jgi:hypothetical protein